MVRDDAVDRGMRAVEAVARERLEVLPDLLDHVGVHAVAEAALDELHLLRVELLADLLADRKAEDVGLREREAGERLRHRHHVLLIDHHAVGLSQDRLQRMGVGHRLLPVLAADVRRDVVHRPRTEERDHRHDVLDPVRFQIADVAAHARGLELEHARGLSRTEQVEGLLVVERDTCTIDVDPARGLDQLQRLVQDREVR